MPLEHEQSYGLGMDAVVIVCFWNTRGIMAWAWMLWVSYALGTRTELWSGRGCSGYRMHWEQERYYGLGINALVIESARNTNVIMVWAWMLWFVCTWNTNVILGHACSGYRMLWEHGRYYGLGMDALVILCSWNMNVMTAWAWMQWFSHTLETRTLSWFGHCSNRVHGIYAVFRAFETLRRCASGHASHIRRGRQSMHFFAFTLRRNQEQ